MSKKALFINGVFELVVEEIIQSQSVNPGRTFYLQPHANRIIRLLEKTRLDNEHQITVYLSTSSNLNSIIYSADIVNWENKYELDTERLSFLNHAIKSFQPSEEEIYLQVNGKQCINLISIVNAKRLFPPISVSNLIKTSDNKRLSPNRTRAGGWSPVYKIELDPSIFSSQFPTIAHELHQEAFEKILIEAKNDSHESRKERLSTYNKVPEKIKIISTSYIRNPDIVAEVLYRANGKCERCGNNAPFIRAKDNTPYLEVHHRQPISKGGEDSLENSMALCPNCHRELHFGLVI